MPVRDCRQVITEQQIIDSMAWVERSVLVRRRHIEAARQFRRANGHLHLPTLRQALEREMAETVGPVVHTDDVSAA